MTSKPFTQQAFKKYDQKARDALRRSTLLQGFLQDRFGVDSFTFNPDQYGVDFVGFDSSGDPIRGVEVETKNAPQFRNGKFGFATVHFAGRKKHLFDSGDLLVQFDGRYEFAVVVDPTEARYFMESKFTNRNAGEEDFVAVPTADVFIVKVDPEVEGPEVQEPKVAPEISLEGF